jgi:hypothetical protein
MAIFSRKELVDLMGRPRQKAVTIYMPTHPVREKEQDPIRLKNLIGEAERGMIAAGARRPEAEGVLEPARRMVDDALFWRHRGRGLAVFASQDYFTYYRTPQEPREAVTVGESFQLAPMLPLLFNNGRYYVLALSEQEVRLLECSRDGCREATPKDMPHGMAQAVDLDTPEQLNQYHTTGAGRARRSVAEAGSRSHVGGGEQIFHGNAAVKDLEKKYILEFCHQVSAKVEEVLEQNNNPLILASDEPISSIYRQARPYRNLLPQGIPGNPDGVSDRELHQKSWEVVREVFERDMRRALENYHLAASRGLAAAGIRHVLPPVYDGRAAVLFLARGEQYSGVYDPGTRTIKTGTDKAGAGNLLDLAAMTALRDGADVYVLEEDEMPDKSIIAAEFRY